MKFVDTHAHPHMKDYKLPETEFAGLAEEAGVQAVVCVGTSANDSRRAIEFASRHKDYYASVGLHPHDSEHSARELTALAGLISKPKVVAVGECGLDYYYEHSPREKQSAVFRWQLELALMHGLPMIFHVRNAAGSDQAFTDFFEIIDEYAGPDSKVRGVVHSFTADEPTAQECVKRGFYIGLNGIMTFTKDERQLAAARAVPPANLVLETDAPFLTPAPYRGTINHSAYVKEVAEFLSRLRGEPLQKLAETTSKNARRLFKL